MWKKQWSRLKTALKTPEEYVEEEVPPEEAEEVSTEAPTYNDSAVIEIQNDDMIPIMQTVEQIRQLKILAGEMLLKQETDKKQMVELVSQLNQKMREQIGELRSIYNVEPTVDYALNFPTGDGDLGTLTREDPE